MVTDREAAVREKKQRGARKDALMSKQEMMHRETSKNEAAAAILKASACEHLEKVRAFVAVLLPVMPCC